MTNLDQLNNVWVYQENSLIQSSYYLSTNEQKLIRILSSFVNKYDSDFKEYIFNVTELAEKLGINSKNSYRELEKISSLLMSRYVKIKNPSNPKDWFMFHIIKTAKCLNGKITLKIDSDMKNFYLKLQQYTKYKLENILEFKNKHSFRFYEFLKQFENTKHGKTWERILEVENIKEILDISKKYLLYSDFKKRVLLPSQKEINEKTDLYFAFEEIKTAKKVTAIKFIAQLKNKTGFNSSISIDKINVFIAKFNTTFDSNLAGTTQTKELVVKLISSVGLNHFEKCFKQFPQVIGAEVKKGNIRSLEGLFMNFVKHGYNFNSSMLGQIGHEVNFEQREYTEEDFEEFYFKVE